MPHIPTAAQLTKLATLQATLVTAEATLVTAQATLATDQAAVLAALKAAKNYEAYIYGNANYPGAIDVGGFDVT